MKRLRDSIYKSKDKTPLYNPDEKQFKVVGNKKNSGMNILRKKPTAPGAMGLKGVVESIITPPDIFEAAHMSQQPGEKMKVKKPTTRERLLRASQLSNRHYAAPLVAALIAKKKSVKKSFVDLLKQEYAFNKLLSKSGVDKNKYKKVDNTKRDKLLGTKLIMDKIDQVSPKNTKALEFLGEANPTLVGRSSIKHKSPNKAGYTNIYHKPKGESVVPSKLSFKKKK